MPVSLTSNEKLLSVIQKIIDCAPDIEKFLSPIRLTAETCEETHISFLWGELAMTLALVGSSHPQRNEFRKIMMDSIIPEARTSSPPVVH